MLSKRTIKSFENIIQNHGVKLTFNELALLKDIDSKNYRNYIIRYFKYRRDYQEVYDNNGIEEIIELFKIWLKREKTNKITIDLFYLYGLNEIEYSNYVNNKTSNMIHKSKTNPARWTHEDFVEKYGEGRALEIKKAKNTTSIDYFLKKTNNNLKLALKLQKERQTTFSLEICIEKHGKEKGIEVFNARQEKWQETLNSKPQEEIDNFNKKKNTFVIKTTDKLEYFDSSFNSIINRKNASYNDLDGFIDYQVLKYNNSVLSCRQFTPTEYYKNLTNAIKFLIPEDLWLEKTYGFHKTNKIIKSFYGYIHFVDEGILRSNLEFRFYENLKKFNIHFELEGYYPNSKMKYDFYLPTYDFYIEIAGMMNIKSYEEKMKLKVEKFGSIVILPNQIDSFFSETLNLL